MLSITAFYASQSLKLSERYPAELIRLLRDDHHVDESVLAALTDAQVDGERFVAKGFVSSFFTEHQKTKFKVNPQKLIEVRNKLTAPTNVQAPITTAPNPLSNLNVVASRINDALRSSLHQNENLNAAVSILDTLRAAPSYAGQFCAALHFALTCVQNVYGNSKDQCLELMEDIRLTIKPHPEFIFNPPHNYVDNFKCLLRIVEDSRQLIARFVPIEGTPTTVEKFQYWLDLLTARKGDFNRMKERLKDARERITFVVAVGTRAQQLNPNAAQPVAATPNLNVAAFTAEIQEECRKWYKRSFALEFSAGTSSSDTSSSNTSSADASSSARTLELESLFIELKVLLARCQRESTTGQHDLETLFNSGEIADTSSLHSYLWTKTSNQHLVLVEGAAGIGKTTFCQKFCCLQSIQGAIVIFVALKKMFDCGSINSIDDLLSVIDAPEAVKEALPNILGYNIPIVWVVDGFDEVMRTDDQGVQTFLHNFVDPATRKKHLRDRTLQHLVRLCDAVVLTSRENRIDTNIVTIDNVNDPSLRPDLWIVQRWKKADIKRYITTFFEKLNRQITPDDICLLVDHALGPQMSGFHGIPLFVKLLCEAKLQDANLDVHNISPTFLYQKTLRNAFDRATVRINYVLDIDASFVRWKNDLDGLYDSVLEQASKHAFDEFLAHRGAALTFSVPRDEKLPLWIQVMREMGVLLNDSSDDTKFKFPHRTFIEFLVAHQVALFPTRLLPKVPFLNDLDTTWLLICQFALLRQKDSFFERILKDGITPTLLAKHVAERSVKIYHEIDKEQRHRRDRADVLAMSEKCSIKLLVQIANALGENLVMDSVLSQHCWGGGPSFLVRNASSLFRWMVEWCGYYAALDALTWFDAMRRFRDVVLSEGNCKLGVCRVLQRQGSSRGQLVVDFLLPRAGRISPLDAINADSAVALQYVLVRQDSSPFTKEALLQVLQAVASRKGSNPDLVATLFLYVKFTDEQRSLFASTDHCNFIFQLPLIAALQFLPKRAEVWDFEEKTVRQVDNVEAEIFKTRKWLEGSLRQRTNLFGHTSTIKILDLSRLEIADASLQNLSNLDTVEELNLSENRKISGSGLAFLSEMKKLKKLVLWGCSVGAEYLHYVSALESLDELNLGFNRYITGVGLEYLRFCTQLTKLILSGCNISDDSLEYLSSLVSLVDLDLSCNPKITGSGLVHLSKMTVLTKLHLRSCNITDESLSFLQSFKFLARLDLNLNEKITCLEPLCQIKSLRELFIRNCSDVTEAGKCDLKKALGRLSIVS